MNGLLKKLKIYTRLCLVVAVALAVMLIIFKNYGRQVDFWFFHDFREVSVLWLIGCTAAGSIVSYWVALTLFSLWKDMRELRREAAQHTADEDHRKRAESLAEQERRIDQKRAELLRGEPDPEPEADVKPDPEPDPDVKPDPEA
jgi:hypothetical protein